MRTECSARCQGPAGLLDWTRTRSARVGDVRLGELGVPDDDHRGDLSDLLPEGRRGGSAGAGRHQPLRVGDDHRHPDRRGRSRRCSARSPTTRRSRRSCSASSSPSAPPPPAAMFFITRGDWLFALVLFVVGNVGVAGSIVFYESLLPHLVREDELDRVSSAGYAVGYLGGGVLLAINMLMMSRAGDGSACRAARSRSARALRASAVWWVVFSIPLFRQRARAAAAARARTSGRRATRSTAAARRLLETLRRAARATGRRSCCCSRS